MSVSINYITPSTTLRKVELEFTYYGNGTGGFSFYIYVRAKGSSYWGDPYSGSTTHGGASESTVSTSITNKRHFTGTEWEFRVEVKSDYSSVSTVYIPSLFEFYPDYTIPERPTQQTQNVYKNGAFQGEAGTCVANTCASAKEIQEMRNGKTILNYSIAYFYGMCGNGSTESLNYEHSFNQLMNNGIPPYQVVTNNVGVSGYPDTMYQPDAKSTYNLNKGKIDNYCLPQKIASWRKITADIDWNYEGVMNSIKRNSSSVVMTLVIDSSLDNAAGNGWVGGLTGNTRIGHAMLVLGWITSSNKKYWVCQNSWTYTNGSAMGQNGIYFIPFDWYTASMGAGINDFYELIDDPSAPPLPPLPDSGLKPPYSGGNEEWGSTGRINVKWDTSASMSNYELRIKDENGNYTYKQTTSNSVSADVGYGYSIWVSVRGLKSGVWGDYTRETKLTMNPKTPEIEYVKSTTSTNLIVQLTNRYMSGRFTNIRVRRHSVPFVGDSTYIDQKFSNSASDSLEWTGLTSGSVFTFTAMSNLTIDGATLWSLHRTANIDGTVGNIRPSFFYWDNPNPKVKGETFDIKASEWNRLIKNINDMLTYKGKPTKVFTTISKGDLVLATIFNQVRSAIYNSDGLNGLIAIPYATKDKDATAEHFNKIQESLNSVI